MTKYKINTVSTNGISNNSIAVYAGKSGFNTKFGVIPIIASAYTVTTPEIEFSVSNLNLIYNDFFSPAATVGLSNVFIQAPTNQFSISDFQLGSTGYIDNPSFTNLEIRAINLQANTITVFNKSENGRSISSSLQSAPLRLFAYQPSVSNNVAYVYGSDARITEKFSVSGYSGDYVLSFKVEPQLRRDIVLIVDNVVKSSFNWPLEGNARQASISLTGTDDELEYIINSTRIPALESNDAVSLYSSNTYKILATSYQSNNALSNSELTNAGIFKVQLDKDFPAEYLGRKIVNISPDAEVRVSNVQSNSFEFEFANSYPYSYSLANNNLYYFYNKNSVRFTQGRLDEYGRLLNVPTGTYVINLHNVNRYNRVSPKISDVITVENIRLPKVQGVTVTENIIIDTLGGASINALISFLPITTADVDTYEILYKIDTAEGPNSSQYTKLLVAHNQQADRIRLTINNLVRGRVSGSNILNILITPIKGSFRGLSVSFLHPLIGKTAKPNGVRNLSVAQQSQNILFTWGLVLTADGYPQDLDATEIELREYSQAVDVSSPASLEAAWNAALTIDRIPYKNTSFITPISKYGTYTYMLRVRDTSNIESDVIAAKTITLTRPYSNRIFKAYNESDPATSYLTQDDLPFPNSNTTPEVSYPSVNDVITNGFVVAGLSSNTDNSNGSSIGFSAVANSQIITTGSSSVAEYVTQIRDMGSVIKGTIRISPSITIATPNNTFTAQKETLITGVTDFHGSEGLSPSANVLVDNAFGGIGHILGFNNANDATVSYNSYHRTLTSGGAFGNVYAIFTGASDLANANSYALIAGVINANAIALGNSYHANGNETYSNALGNVTIAGNSYQLVNLYQYGDPAGALTYFGPESGVTQNLFIRYSTDNVYYSAAANGVVGYPNHGNTNPFAFIGASTNSELGFSSFVSGEIDFRYFQIKLTVSNKFPTTTQVNLDSFKYEVDVQEKILRRTVSVSNTNGIVLDYSSTQFILAPTVTATLVNSTSSYTTSVSEVSNTSCRITVRDSQSSLPVDTESVNVFAIGI